VGLLALRWIRCRWAHFLLLVKILLSGLERKWLVLSLGLCSHKNEKKITENKREAEAQELMKESRDVSDRLRRVVAVGRKRFLLEPLLEALGGYRGWLPEAAYEINSYPK